MPSTNAASVFSSSEPMRKIATCLVTGSSSAVSVPRSFSSSIFRRMRSSSAPFLSSDLRSASLRSSLRPRSKGSPPTTVLEAITRILASSMTPDGHEALAAGTSATPRPPRKSSTTAAKNNKTKAKQKARGRPTCPQETLPASASCSRAASSERSRSNASTRDFSAAPATSSASKALSKARTFDMATSSSLRETALIRSASDKAPMSASFESRSSDNSSSAPTWAACFSSNSLCNICAASSKDLLAVNEPRSSGRCAK
mmetsp:Transcript_16242/g.47067  ORF Transcript_16242/g.47067 Transcript_16242/m.47067 type:complete len:258 (+) Transcript_16242:659-1432(+)